MAAPGRAAALLPSYGGAAIALAVSYTSTIEPHDELPCDGTGREEPHFLARAEWGSFCGLLTEQERQVVGPRQVLS